MQGSGVPGLNSFKLESFEVPQLFAPLEATKDSDNATAQRLSLFDFDLEIASV
jgi:hypothetical protein